MSDRPTPETDAAERMAFAQEYMVPTEFARRLERDRDQAREAHMEALCDCQRLARKIDDIRDVFDHQDEDWTGSITLAKAVSKVIRERDEARELVKTYKDYAQLLGDEISDTAALAYVHGWRSKRHEQGKLLQDKIKQLEAKK